MADTFSLRNKHLTRLCAFNHFAVPTTGLIFFGFRGLTPADPVDHEFRPAQGVSVVKVDYIHPRCTLVQWDRDSGTLAVFPGSTVPALHLFAPRIVDSGRGANQLMTGYYRDGYSEGVHRRGTSTGHEAFRQEDRVPVRRTADDEDYDVDDRVEFGRPFDNLHAAWVDSATSSRYSSLGCQVVVGRPDSERHSGNTGPWKAFKEFAYTHPQTRFPYVLLPGSHAARIAAGASAKDLTRLRFGSSGALVKVVQQTLNRFGHGLEPDGKFGINTMRAVMDFQLAQVGPRSDDAIVGSRTAEALVVLGEWPGRRASHRPQPATPGALDWTTVSLSERRVHVTRLLTKRYGYPVESAVGLVGNFEVESGIIPNRLESSSPSEPMRSRDNKRDLQNWTPEQVMNRVPGESGPARAGVGLAQWTSAGRRRGLFAHEFDGRPAGVGILFDLDAQVDYAVHELRSAYGALNSLLREPETTVEEAAAEVVYDYERPGSVLETIDGRTVRRSRDDPKVLAVFEERSSRARAALADFEASGA